MTRSVTPVQGLRSASGHDVFGGYRVRVIDFDVTSYVAGGESLTPTEAIGLLSIDTILSAVNVSTTAAGRDTYLVWDEANKKILGFVASTGVEKAAAQAFKFRLVVMGV